MPPKAPKPSTDKKQRTISSFFAPKPSPTAAQKPVASTPSPAPKPPYEPNSDDDELYSLPKSTKKSFWDGKLAEKRALDEKEKDGDAVARKKPRTNGAVDSSPKGKKVVDTIAASSQTARKYRYDPTSSQANADAMDVDGDAPLNATREKQKAKLHEQFVKKLANPDSLRDPWQQRESEEGLEGEDDEPAEPTDEPEPGPIAKKFGSGKSKATKNITKTKKLTPLEQQVVDIKQSHIDTVLVVEVGYKFRFFGEDASIAAKTLSIMCIPGKMRFDNHPSEAHYDKFASASIPTHRLHVHVKRLVEAGYKVGVVRQLETAALKAAGDNKSGPFERKLTNLYTKGTYIDDLDAMEGGPAAGAGASNTGYLLCITEKPGGGSGTDEKCHVGMVAVQPSTGDVIYDEFDDGFMRTEIETRLLHVAPCEILITGELTKATDKMVTHLAGSTTTVFGEKVRVERVDRAKKAEAEASTYLSQFYADKLGKSDDSPDAAEKNKMLDAVMGLPGLVTICLASMIKHLSSYGLEHVFDLTTYFTSFSARSHMLLNGNTLSSLEIYKNGTDFTSRGSLFWTLDRTKTKFGRRLLRSWVGRPLLDRKQLQLRVEAVEEMKDSDNPRLARLKELLCGVQYDLEKGLIRIYYGKCTRPELFKVLKTMQTISTTFQLLDLDQVGFNSELINTLISRLPTIKASVTKYLDVFNHHAAAKDDKEGFFREAEKYEAINFHMCGIAAVETDLQAHLKDIAKALKVSKCSYVTVSGVEYLIEVGNDKASQSKLPAPWVKISSTKKVSRYHTPQVLKMIQERDKHKESLAAECDKAFRDFLAEISTEYQSFRDTVHALATLDCLISLATVASQPGYVKPEFTDDNSIHVEEGRHPMVEQILLDTYVPNDISLSSSGPRAMLITGPNMGGKSSYVRQVALISIMAQIGSYVPASSAKLGLLDAVFTRMGTFDNMLAGESTFMVELSETAHILKAATPRSLVILDELGRGTSTHDGVAIANAVLDYVVTELRSFCLFITHYPLLATFGERWPEKVRNAHMTFEEKHREGEESEVTFLYKVGEGVAHRSYGLNVARLAGLPRGVLEVAREKASGLEEELRGREGVRWRERVRGLLEGDGDVERFLEAVEAVEELEV